MEFKQSEGKNKVNKAKSLVVRGKRKTAIAKATIKDGEGIIKINYKPLDVFDVYRRLQLFEPIKIAENVIGDKINKIDIYVNVKGGGFSSQTQAAKLAIARALVAFTKNQKLEKAFLSYSRDLVDEDVRRKEPRKPRDSKARAKRQKSYR